MKNTWYIFDSESNIINEGEGIEDRNEAIENFKSRYTEDEAREYGFTLCKVLEDDQCWYECLEELTADDIY